ncbi:hypothetical protein [Stratiformator vulcanicus]|uniref:Uncharacterized protein n=1 Tax=Stratiformator vulcanicus TaxID=2527980 RepID=A0A517R3G4_9PLAN|nr:hypothetical protein [Stratiformator vulcanicus]QDT38390.1 hypothetical protein Pan189_27830 [Stratiformator vulcanicus]
MHFITEKSLRSNPVVRVESDQAIAFGGLGETLSATRLKHWDEGPQILPLEPDDWFDPNRITYVYRENSLYNRRFLRRRRLKELPGQELTRMVEAAKYRGHDWETSRRHILTRAIERQIEARLALTA